MNVKGEKRAARSPVKSTYNLRSRTIVHESDKENSNEIVKGNKKSRNPQPRTQRAPLRPINEEKTAVKITTGQQTDNINKQVSPRRLRPQKGATAPTASTSAIPHRKVQKSTIKRKEETTKKVAGNAKKVTAKSKKNVRAMKTSNENDRVEQNKNGDKFSTQSSTEISKEASIITNNDAVASSHQNQPAQLDCSTDSSKMPIDAKSNYQSSQEMEKSTNDAYVGRWSINSTEIVNPEILNEQFGNEFKLLSEFENAGYELWPEEGASMNYVESGWDSENMDHKNTEHQGVDFNVTSTPQKIIKQESVENTSFGSSAINSCMEPTAYVWKDSSTECNSKKEVTKKSGRRRLPENAPKSDRSTTAAKKTAGEKEIPSNGKDDA